MRTGLKRRASALTAWFGGVLLVACASGLPPGEPPEDPVVQAIQESAWARQTRIRFVAEGKSWQHKTFGDRKPTLYQPTFQAGRPAIHALSIAGNSSLRQAVDPPPGVAVDQLRFSWLVLSLNEAADLRDNDIDDAVARVMLGFDGDRAARFSARDHMLSELAQLVTGEPLPYATLIYVWDNRYPVGTVIANPHTDRIRHLVVESGPARLGRWVDQERDVQADFSHAFGEKPGPLRSVGVMSDANNTGASVEAWFGPLQLGFSDRSSASTTQPMVTTDTRSSAVKRQQP
ncbi:MAG: DUF3047 domain-containing protein [Hydrogenophaga sp.]|jgi:hypothetical protein|nr:DUF3047 domain-containing protein [Hydrogenophaga sp.]